MALLLRMRAGSGRRKLVRTLALITAAVFFALAVVTLTGIKSATHPTSPLRPLHSVPPTFTDHLFYGASALGFRKPSWLGETPVCPATFTDHVVDRRVTEIGLTDNRSRGEKPWQDGTCASAVDCPFVWVTMSTGCSAGAERLVSQLASKDIAVAVIGFADPWHGFGKRMRLYHDYLLTLPDDSIAVLSDADDVMVAPRCFETDIVDAFRAFNVPVVFMSEPYCWPDGGLWWRHPEVPSPPKSRPTAKSEHRYLNAGTVIGTVKHLREYVRDAYDLDRSDFADDQGAFMNLFIDRHQRRAGARPGPQPPTDFEAMGVTLDYYGDLLLSLAGGSVPDYDIDVAAGSLTRKVTGGRSCIWHQNGNKAVNHVLEELAAIFGVKSSVA
ncbi:hypothetical protein HKX48_003470 [Thoreauomyces humboldtii]|nr:hypothetical protein HKX48_003470 [Thoreauomyces humboldtii]